MNAQSFLDTVNEAGYSFSSITPGKWERGPVPGKKGNAKDAFAYLDPSELWGTYGDWPNGFKRYWRHKDVELCTPEQRINFDRLIREVEEIARRKQLESWAEYAKQAQEEWGKAQPANPDHPYLRRKRVKSHGLRQIGENLMMALSNSDNIITTHQIIRPDGSKKFMYGGKKQGSFFIIRGITDRTFLCEGFATGASVFEATGRTVYVAVDAGNLMPVAEGMIEKGVKRIIIAADNDNGK